MFHVKLSKQFARELCLLVFFAVVLFSGLSFVVRALFKLNNSDSYVSGDEFVRIRKRYSLLVPR